MSRHPGFRLFAALSYPVAWSILILLLAGELGAAQNTLVLSHWLLSWFLVPSPEMLSIFNHILRKSSHLIIYGVLFLLWQRAFQRELGWSWRRATLAALGLCLALAIMDETWQSWTGGRQARGGDVLLDLAGAGLAALLTWKFWRPSTPKPSSPERRIRLV